VLEVFDEVEMPDGTTAGALALLATRFANHKGGITICGPAPEHGNAPTAVESDWQHVSLNAALMRLGCELAPLAENPSPIDRVAACNAMLAEADGARRLFVDARCTTLIADLQERFFHEDRRELRRPEDVGDPGPMSDALTYLCYAMSPLEVHAPAGAVLIGASK
jgi:hypothetical protein